mgnify:CR=1 FL=1
MRPAPDLPPAATPFLKDVDPRLNALVMPGNRPMIRLLRHLDLPEKMYWEDGVERVEISLSQEAGR